MRITTLWVPTTTSTQVKRGMPLRMDGFLGAGRYAVRRQARCKISVGWKPLLPPGSSAGVKEEQTGALNIAGRRTMASVVHTERVKSKGARSALPMRCPRFRVCGQDPHGKHLGEASRRPCLAASPCARQPEKRVDDQAAGMNPLVSPVPILWRFRRGTYSIGTTDACRSSTRSSPAVETRRAVWST